MKKLLTILGSVGLVAT
ncbi:lipoprotein, partial [Mycoplasma mycoides]